MSNTNAKRMNKFLSILFFVAFGIVLSFGLIFVQSKNVASAEGEEFYTISVTATNGNVNLSYVGDDEHYVGQTNILMKESATSYKILKSVVDDAENDFKIKITGSANLNYVFDSYSVDGVVQTEDKFKITGDASVVVNFVPKTFTVKVSTSFSSDGTNFQSDNTLLTNNLSTALDQIKVDAYGSVFDQTNNVVATALRDSDKLEFLGYFVVGSFGDELDVTDGLKIKTLNVDDDFISSFVKSGEIKIVARYAFKKQVNISIDEDSVGLGSFDVFVRSSENELVDFVSGNYYSYGSKVSVVPVANKNYVFAGYNLNSVGNELYGKGYTKEISYDDVSLVLFFTPDKYEIKFDIVNSIGETIGSEKINVSTGNSLSYVTTNVVSFGEKINEIKFNKISKYANYTFKGWYLFKNDGTKVSFSSTDNKEIVKNVLIDSDFVENFVSNGAINFYGEFVQDCQLSIIMQDAYPTNSTFTVFKDGHEVSTAGTFEYGTNLVVEVPQIDHMVFVGFEGLIDDDQYVEGSSRVDIKMNGNRSVSAKYEYIKTGISVDEKSKLKNVRVELSSDEIRIGDTLIINAKVSDGFRVKTFNINGKSAEDFVKELNENESSSVAICGDNGIVTIYVNKNVYDFFAGSPVLSVEAVAKVDSTYVALFVLYLVLAVLLGAVMIVFLILANKKYFKIKKLKRTQEEKIKEKEEANKVETLSSQEENKTEVVIEETKVAQADEKPVEKKKTKSQAEKSPVKKTTTKKTSESQTKKKETGETKKTEKKTTKNTTSKTSNQSKPKTKTTESGETKNTVKKTTKTVKKETKTEGGKN